MQHATMKCGVIRTRKRRLRELEKRIVELQRKNIKLADSEFQICESIKRKCTAVRDAKQKLSQTRISASYIIEKREAVRREFGLSKATLERIFQNVQLSRGYQQPMLLK